MRIILIVILTAVCLVKVSEGYKCYECNSTIDVNCFAFSPTFSYYKAVDCDLDKSGRQNCYAIQVSERKQRKMYRGCKKANICEDYEDQERDQIHFKVLSCYECHDEFCNSSKRTSCLSSITILLLSLIALFC